MRNAGLVLLAAGLAILLYDVAIGFKTPGGQTIDLIFVVGAMIAIGAVLAAIGWLARK